MPNGQWSLRSDASHGLIVADRLGNDVVVHDLPDDGAEWTVQSVFIDDGRMVLSEHGDTHGSYRVWVYELDSGEGRTLDLWDGSIDLHRWPRLALTGSWLAWEVTRADGGLCLTVDDLASGERFEPVCVDAPEPMPMGAQMGLGWSALPL